MTSFWKLLDDLFGDASERKLAQVKLERFYQGQMDFPSWIQQFEILVGTAGYMTVGTFTPHQMLISLMEKLIHRDMLDRMYGMDIAPPTTYTKYKTRLNNISINIERRKALNAGTYTYGTAPVQQQQGQGCSSGDSTRPSAGVTSGAGAPMDVDRKRSRSNACYNCGKPGHIAANCRSPKKQTKVRSLLTELKEGKEIKMDDLLKAIKEEDF